MTLNFFIKGQNVECRTPGVMVSDTIKYFDAKFNFLSGQWDNTIKWAHFSLNGGEPFDFLLENDKITQDKNLSLSAGTWAVWVHGNKEENGEITQRITTDKCYFEVEQSGALNGAVLPEIAATAAEQIAAKAQNALEVANETAEKMENFEVPEEDIGNAVEKYFEGNPIESTGGAAFPVVITETDGVCSADKTFEEIKAAFDAGRQVYCRTALGIMPVLYASDAAMTFGKTELLDDNGAVMFYCYQVLSDDTVDRFMYSTSKLPNPYALTINGQTYDGSKEVSVEIEAGADGKDGEDGSSVTVESISESAEDGGENVVTFSDGNTLTVKNGSRGSDGETGAAGADGADGFSPTVSISGDNEKTTVTITDTEGEKSFDVYNGKDGEQGPQGEKGEDGSSGVYMLAEGETIEDAPADAAVVVDPYGTADEGNGGSGDSSTWELMGEYKFLVSDRKIIIDLAQFKATHFRILGTFPKCAEDCGQLYVYLGTKLNQITNNGNNQNVYAFNVLGECEIFDGQIYGYIGCINGWAPNIPVMVARDTPRDTAKNTKLTLYYYKAVEDSTENTIQIWGY